MWLPNEVLLYIVNLSGGTQTNTNARPNSAGDARAQGLGGLGGLGVPGMEQLLTGGMPDTSQLEQLFQNPALMQLTQSLLSNPQYMNQVILLKKTHFRY